MIGEYKQLLLKAEDTGNAPPKNSNGKQLLLFVLGFSCLLALTCVACVVTTRVAQVDGAIQFDAKADIHSSMESPKYYWQSARGNVGKYTQTPYPVEFNLHRPSWTWNYQCCFGCTWCTFSVGVALDDHKNIYLTSADRVRKFSTTGKLLWIGPREDTEELHNAVALMDGAVHAITTLGRAYALNMRTGKELWSAKLAQWSSGNFGQVAAQHGVAIHPADVKLFGLNATDGNTLWVYEPEEVVWNWGATFPGDGTFVYETQDGKVHRQYVNNGALIWKAGGVPGTWTDGQCNLGSNGVVYAPATYYNTTDDLFANMSRGVSSLLAAHRLSDGHLIWKRNLTKPPNSIPAIGMLAGQTKLSVVMPVGYQCQMGQEINVLAFDAETGEDQWVFNGPTQLALLGSPSDSNPIAVAQRNVNSVMLVTMPNPWGSPVIDGNGAVFVGGITGHLFRLQDSNQDGIVAGHGEVAKMTTDADWVGGSGPAIAPGLFAVGNSHSLFVWHGY